MRSTSSRLSTAAFAVLVAGLVVLAFAPAFEAGWLTWDDDRNFLENEAWRGLSPAHLRWMFTTFHMGPYQPLAWVTLGIDHALWGMDPRGYHVTNVLIQAAAAVAFFCLARALFRAVLPLASRSSVALDASAALASLAFGVHPLRCESVAWITERRDVLSGLFLILAVLWYVKWTRAPLARKRTFVASLAFYVLSLLSKGLGMMLPAVLLVLDVLVLGRWNATWNGAALADGRRSFASLLREKIPFAIPAAVAIVLAWFGQRSQDNVILGLDQHGVGARLVQSIYGLWFYVSKTIWPVDLVPLVPLPKPLDPSEPRFVVALVAVPIACAGLWFVRRRLPLLVASALVYAIFLLPVLGLTQTGPQLVADRYSYLACMPFALLLGGEALRRLSAGRVVSIGVSLCGAILVAVLVLACRVQTRIWHDPIALWTKTCDVQRGNPLAFANLTLAYIRAAQAAPDPVEKRALYEKGLAECARGMEPKPDPRLLTNASSIHAALSGLDPERAREWLEQALAEARQAIELSERVQEPIEAAYSNYAEDAIELGRPADAVPAFAWLADHRPDDADTALKLGQTLELAGRPRDALVALERARSLAPDAPLVWMEIGNAHKLLAEDAEAVRCYERGIALAEAAAPDRALPPEELASWKALLAGMRH